MLNFSPMSSSPLACPSLLIEVAPSAGSTPKVTPPVRSAARYGYMYIYI